MYLKIGDYSDSMNETAPVRWYENAKEKHWTTKIVVPTAMLTFGIVSIVIFLSSYVRYTSTTDEKVLLPIFMGIAVSLFFGGALLGKMGWTKNEK